MSKEPDVIRWSEDLISRERWEGLVGDSVSRLVNAVEGPFFPHAMLLVGPQALGRELVTIELAAALVCQEGGSVWCACPSCARVRGGVHPDVVLVQGTGASKKINIEQVRGIVEQAPGKPFEGRHRVWILDGVESGKLGPEAANALLKTLEEPPPHVRFLLLAANPEGVLATIRSRCQTTMLPGVVAAATWLRTSGPAELAGWSGSGVEIGAEVEAAKEVIAGAKQDRELMPLLRLVRRLRQEPWAFEVLEAASLDLAANDGDGGYGEAYLRLASDLLGTQARVAALNLNQGRQMLACLLSWAAEDLALSAPV